MTKNLYYTLSKRVINGRKFRPYGYYNSKKEANYAADGERTLGLLARVVKYDKGYVVYIANKH